MIAKCKICNVELVNNIVGQDDQTKSIEIGKMMLAHMLQIHTRYMKQLAQDSRIFSGFVVMNRFIVDDPGVEEEKEVMRDKLADIVMEDSPEEAEVDMILEEEDEEDDDDIEGDEDNYEDGEDLEDTGDVDAGRVEGTVKENKKDKEVEEKVTIIDVPSQVVK